MKRTLKRMTNLYWVDNLGNKIYGKNEQMKSCNDKLSGNCTRIRGNCDKIYGDCSNLSGDCTNLEGDATGVWGICTQISGNLDDCQITEDERQQGVSILDLIIIHQ